MTVTNSTKDGNHLKPFTNTKDLDSRKKRPDRYEISYVAQPALRVRVNPSGKKIFIWRIQYNGKRRIIPIGEYGKKSGQIGIAAAHTKLEKLQERHKNRTLFTDMPDTPKTVGELAELFYKDRILPHRKRPEVVRYILDSDIIPNLGKRKIESVDAIDISNLISTVVNRGALSHAGKVLAVTKQLFKFAVSRGYISQSPAYSHDPKDLGVVNHTKDRSLDAEEIIAFWSALDKAPRMSAPVRTGFKVLLLSGVRSGELRLAKWKDIDFEKKEWSIPEENSKTRAWTVPLSSYLLKLFRELQGYAGDSIYVVPGIGRDKEGRRKDAPITEKVFPRAMERLFDIKVDKKLILPIQKATPHDLRRTFRSHTDDLGIEPHIAEKCLNHSLGKISETYNTNPMLEQRMDALEKWGDYIDLLVTPRENVRVLSA